MLNCTADQELLREALWPTIRTSVLMHDSSFRFGERRDVAPIASLPAGDRLGCDWRQVGGYGPPLRKFAASGVRLEEFIEVVEVDRLEVAGLHLLHQPHQLGPERAGCGE